MALISACQLDLADQNRDDLFCSLIHPEDWLSLELLREENSPYIRANESYPFLSRPLWEDVLASLDKCTNSAEVKDCALLVRMQKESGLRREISSRERNIDWILTENVPVYTGYSSGNRRNFASFSSPSGHRSKRRVYWKSEYACPCFWQCCVRTV